MTLPDNDSGGFGGPVNPLEGGAGENTTEGETGGGRGIGWYAPNAGDTSAPSSVRSMLAGSKQGDIPKSIEAPSQSDDRGTIRGTVDKDALANAANPFPIGWVLAAIVVTKLLKLW